MVFYLKSQTPFPERKAMNSQQKSEAKEIVQFLTRALGPRIRANRKGHRIARRYLSLIVNADENDLKRGMEKEIAKWTPEF